MEVQTRLDAVANQIWTAPGAASGLGGVTTVPRSRKLVVYWKGSLPSSSSELIRSIRRQTSVEVRPASYSAVELSAISQKLAAVPGVFTAGPEADASGVRVTVAAELTGTNRTEALDVGVPVSVSVGQRPLVAACTGRQDDCSPYWGGARYSAGGTCSTGFTINQGGVRKIISAAHCSSDGTTAFDGGGEVVGTVEQDNNPRDTLLILPAAGVSADNRIYAGPPSATWNTSHRVLDALRSEAGDRICTSGAFTGQHCNIAVTATGLFINTDVGVLGPVAEAKQLNGTVAAGDGDSGGPVHHDTPVPGGDVFAKGTMTAINDRVPCAGDSLSVICGSTVYYADMIDSLNFYQALMVS
jgi:hypothetical protein